VRIILSALVLVLAGAPADAAESRGLTIQVKKSAARDAPVIGQVELYGASYALVIGIDAYVGGWPRLSNAVKDARLVAEELNSKGFDVTLHTDLKAADLDRVLREFFVVKGADPKARLFVWYAGHGHSQGGEGFLVPADAPRPDAGTSFKLKALPIRRFGEYVRLAESKHVYSVFDSCFAGTVFDSQRALPSPAITRATTLPVRQFLTSGDADQTVSDDGSFRELFIRALRGEERADANADGYITASELGLHLSDRVTNLTRTRQTPRYGKLRDKDFDRGDFVFSIATGGTGAMSELSPTAAAGTQTTDVVFWQSIKESTARADFEAYLRQFPDGTFAELAHTRMAALGDTRTEFQVEPLDGIYAALKPANLRAHPTTDSTILANLRPGTRLRVTGKVRGRPWYRIDHGTLGRAYVHAALIEHLWYAAIAAAYEGKVTNAVRPQADRVVTRLEVREGKLRGTYTIFETEGQTKGTLGGFVSAGPGKGVFQWRDDYGAGTLAVEFSGDMGAFTGTWTPKGQTKGGGTWSGKR
jgi:hypothetical protein